MNILDLLTGKKTKGEEVNSVASKKKVDAEIMVKVARTGSKVVEIALNGAREVRDALEAAGISKKESEEISVNGEEADLDYELEDGDRVVLTKNIEGGV